MLGGALVMIAVTWYAGLDGLVLGLALTMAAVMMWRLADGPAGYLRDITYAALIVVYVPFLACFAVLLVRPDDGILRVVLTLAGVVLSDTGGYIAGVFFGKHPLAPTVSPKKSWEGAAGSVLATGGGEALLWYLTFHQPWWQGLLFGCALAIAAILGDMAESLIKRDLGVKDMSSLLPGHGGLMDRLDSVLFAVPVAFLLLSVFVPAHS
jgi:phosphatidate cytidylyltransferase